MAKNTEAIAALDSKDTSIISVLRQDAKLSTQQISKKTGIPITTVHNRIRKLQKAGVIKAYTIILDNKKIGKAVAAFILITVDYKLLKELKTTQYELAKKIRAHRLVEAASMVTGTSDIIILVRASGVDELSEFVTKYLRNLEGVDRTQTAVILAEV
ncbi:Lrp/AsnC family transcriptional regulator [Candidatus Woesearchaeota archaeon]|nr:Lrp/AsnC family transcriptional regulator [Candidatus Woesearchaeota archaeon]